MLIPRKDFFDEMFGNDFDSFWGRKENILKYTGIALKT